MARFVAALVTVIDGRVKAKADPRVSVLHPDAVSAPCTAIARVGCPDAGTVLVCHQPHPHPGLDHYDGQEHLWWARTDTGPGLRQAPPLRTPGGTS